MPATPTTSNFVGNQSGSVATLTVTLPGTATIGDYLFVSINASNSTGTTPVVQSTPTVGVATNGVTPDFGTQVTPFTTFNNAGTHLYISWWKIKITNQPASGNIQVTVTLTVSQGHLGVGVIEGHGAGAVPVDVGSETTANSSAATSLSVSGVTILNPNELVLVATYSGNVPTVAAGWTLKSINTNSAIRTNILINNSAATPGSSQTFSSCTQTSSWYLASLIALAPDPEFASITADTSSVSGSLEVGRRFPATISDSSSVSGSVEVARRFPFSLSDSSTVAGNLEVKRRFSSTISDASAVSGSLEVARRFPFGINDTSLVSGSLEVNRRFPFAITDTTSTFATDFKPGFAFSTQPSAITLVQSKATLPGTKTSDSLTLDFSSAIGDLLVLTSYWDATASFSFNDNAGNVYNPVISSSAGSGGQQQNVYVYESTITNLPGSGNLSFSGAWSVSSGDASILVNEYAGESAGSVLIDPLSVISIHAPDDSIKLTKYNLNYSGSVVVGAGYSKGSILTATNGYTARLSNSSQQYYFDSVGTAQPAGPQYNSAFLPGIPPQRFAFVFFALISDSSVQIAATPPSSADGLRRYANGIFQLDLGADTDPTGYLAWTNPNLSGVSYRMSWANIEPSPGVYDFSEITNSSGTGILDVAAQYNKYIGILIHTGSKCPAWLTTPISQGGAGCGTYNYYDKNNNLVAVAAAPWDPIFLAYLQPMIQAFGKLVDQNSRVAYVVVGCGLQDNEAFVTKGSLGVTDPTDGLIALGGGDLQTGLNLWINSTNTIIDTYAAAFPMSQIVFVVGVPLPGNQVPAWDTMNQATIQGILDRGVGLYGAKFGFRSSGLDAGKVPNSYFFEYGQTNPTGFQMTGTFNKTGTDPLAYLTAAKAIANGFLSGATVFELYTNDANDPLLQPTLQLYAYGIFQLFYTGYYEVDRRFPTALVDSSLVTGSFRSAFAFPSRIVDSTVVSGSFSSIPIAELLADAKIEITRADPVATLTRADPVATVSSS